MAQPILKSIPLSELRISKLNMRHSRKKPDVSDILPSIRESGIRQTLLVRKECDGYGVVAGRRRYFALKEIEKETGEMPLVPCAIMTEEDAASAIAASVIENVGRLPASEMEQYTAFKRLHDEGRSVDEIAAFFGVTELLVRRVLALASLADPIRKLYAEDEIDRETIRALTLATEDQQAEWLRLYESEDERAPRGRNCKAWITGGAIITTDKALFDIADHDGQITADLFGEHGVFADPEAFWKAQSAAVAQRIEAYIADGWKDVVCLERGAFFHRWDHQTRTKRQGGKVYVELRHDGTVTFHEGYISQAEARRQEKKTGNDDAHECTSRKEDTRASLEGSKAAAELEEKRARIASLFEALSVSAEARRNTDAYRLCEIFAALLAMSDEEVMEVLAFTMAQTLETGGPVVEAVLHVCETDLPACWKPDAAFFELLRDKRAINAMVADIGSRSLAESCASDTAKVQKAIIGNRIMGHGCEPNPDWRPAWMQVPPARLIEGAGSPPADAWARISGLFERGEDIDGAGTLAFDQPHAA